MHRANQWPSYSDHCRRPNRVESYSARLRRMVQEGRRRCRDRGEVVTDAELQGHRKGARLSQIARARLAGVGRHPVQYWECRAV